MCRRYRKYFDQNYMVSQFLRIKTARRIPKIIFLTHIHFYLKYIGLQFAIIWKKLKYATRKSHWDKYFDNLEFCKIDLNHNNLFSSFKYRIYHYSNNKYQQWKGPFIYSFEFPSRSWRICLYSILWYKTVSSKVYLLADGPRLLNNYNFHNHK